MAKQEDYKLIYGEDCGIIYDGEYVARALFNYHHQILFEDYAPEEGKDFFDTMTMTREEREAWIKAGDKLIMEMMESGALREAG